MSQVATLFWGVVIVGGITVLATAGALLVRRWVPVEVLERHNEVAGFIYSVIGVTYAVLLGFTAIIVWERYDQAETGVGKEANELGDVFRNARAFPDGIRKELETKVRSYVRLVMEKEWPAMAEGKLSPETSDACNQIAQTYFRFKPQTEQERIWYTQSLTSLNQLIDQRRLRVLSSQSTGIPKVMWAVLLGAGAVTLSFSFLFGTRNTAAQLLMTAGLAITISLVLFSVVALERPFAGIARIEPDAFNQLTIMLDRWSPR
jgi:Protein of unknown function (DUF4239)